MRIGLQEIVIIIAVIVLLFWAHKIPDLARSLGRGLKIFKRETKEIREEISDVVDEIKK